MSVSVRPYLAAGVALVAAGIIAIPPSVPPQPLTAAVVPRDGVQVARRIDLTASARPLPKELPTPETFAATVAVIERIDPTARRTASRAVVPAVSAVLVPTPLNAASDAVTAGYQSIQSWVDYGVALTTYALGFVPYGYLIADQVNIFYYSLIRPIADSVVYGLINPVLNDPLSLASYVNGFIAVGQTAINAAINTGIAEFNNFFGWLIPPLPPLPLAVARTAPTVAKQVVSTAVDATDPVAEVTAPSAKLTTPENAASPGTVPKTPVQSETTKAPEASEAVTPTATTVTEPAETIKTTEATKISTTSANGVQAQGEVRDATVGAEKVTPGKTEDAATAADASEKDKAPATAVADPTKTAPATSTGSITTKTTKPDDGSAAKDEPKKESEQG